MIKRKTIIISTLVALFSLISIIVVLSVRITSLSHRLNENLESYNEELSSNKILIDQISQNLQILSSSGNEVRNSLNLPMKSLIQSEHPQNSSDQNDLSVLFFDGLTHILENENEEEIALKFSKLLEDKKLEDFSIKKGFEFKRDNSYSISIFKGNIKYLTLQYLDSNNSFKGSNYMGEPFIIDLNDSELLSLIEKQLKVVKLHLDNTKSLAFKLDQISISSEIVEILTERKLAIHKNEMNEYEILVKEDGFPLQLYKIQANQFMLGSKMYKEIEQFKNALKTFLNETPNRTKREQIDDLVLDKMISVFHDEGFKVLLESNGCKGELSRREDDEFIYFDIVKLDGSILGSYALQRNFGEVLLITGDGKYLKSLKMFSDLNDFKSLIIHSEREERLPYATDDSSENFLIIGTHEHNADTMIIVNANNKTGLLNMISFPRDLYYKGNKINNIYKVFGPARLCSELSKITGLDIEKYISIDMFAFVDVINILGGLEVTLDEDLIDPTYKVKNNGQWSSLFYRKGTHHLDGVAALRIARSRHGSVAYDRSKRQQKIIKSVINSMKLLNAGDINKVYNFVSTVSNYISTNLTIADLVKNFLMYKNNIIGDPSIISTDNVLYATYTNLYLLSPEEQEPLLKDDNFFKGLWIVLPKKNDWNRINKHIKSIVDSGN